MELFVSKCHAKTVKVLLMYATVVKHVNKVNIFNQLFYTIERHCHHTNYLYHHSQQLLIVIKLTKYDLIIYLKMFI